MTRRPRRTASWQELSDLPFADALTVHSGDLEPNGDFDCVHFDQLELGDIDESRARFLECAFTQVSFGETRLRNATFNSVWLRDVRMTATVAAEGFWTDCVLTGCALAGVEAFGIKLRRVTLRGCKLDSVNFRGADLTEVTFDNCILRDVDFSGATLTRSAFPGSRLASTNFTKVTLDAVDLRGADLGLIIDPGAMRGAIISPTQLADMAPLLAEALGITVSEE
ncbi:MAG TPA: pentapeptide repeat-containing protein [Streptosporangiaceae bacterium]|nr:pentapeptide repeat-containing protein [Streptosporangiaceae bacterium]